MLTVGVDLAADPAGTAVAVVRWSEAGARVEDVILPAGDDAVLTALRAADKAGVDCPLGWPEAFVSFVTAHQEGVAHQERAVAGGDRAWRRGLAWRHTDEVVRAAVPGIVPLSVAADRIGHTALRCAFLQARLAAEGRPVDRSGAGPVVEVYPAASLKIWGLPWAGYKRPAQAAARAEILDRLRAEAAWLDLGAFAGRCVRSDHALDAVVAALSARAAACGLATEPSAEQLGAARTEGWIALPTAPLGGLVATGDR
jgi:predicted nuclease with RNAse H fold